MTTMTEAPTILVRCTSHRARAKMLRVTGPLQSWFSWQADSDFYYVPSDQAADVLAITGIRKCRPRTDLHRTIKW